jgi:hypothetical protein
VSCRVRLLTSYTVSQPKRRTRTLLGRCETDSETTSWRRLTGLTLRPGFRRVVRLQEFAAAVEQLAHRAFVGLPEGHIQTEAAHAFIDEIRDWEVKQYLLMGGDRTLNDALNRDLSIEAAKAATRPTARLREVTRVPTGRPPTPPERRRNERPVCWECGRRGRLWKDCRQRPP